MLKQHCNHKQEHSDDDKIENSARRATRRSCFSRIEILGANNSLRSELVEPRQTHRDRKTNRERNYDKPNRRVWNFEERKNLRGELSKEPRDNSISDSCAVNIAPF